MNALFLLWSLTAATPSTAPAEGPDVKARDAASAAKPQPAGSYIEVVATDGGFAKTARCAEDDQLVLAAEGEDLTLRWGKRPAALRLTPAAGGAHRWTLEEPRRRTEVEVVDAQLIRLSFTRKGRPASSYLYGRVEFALQLPTVKGEGKGCTF